MEEKKGKLLTPGKEQSLLREEITSSLDLRCGSQAKHEVFGGNYPLLTDRSRLVTHKRPE